MVLSSIIPKCKIVNDFYINDYESLVEKLNYIIANIKEHNVEIQE
ncbi:hypothetical protein P6N96_14665 [Clostridium perfringens]|nr:hypothetical protein [Clostridium perfringens]MDK0548247.1 hypothetical protein [Clostridium perfringens]MDK0754821.1 hypothetical protein [Clostridium perfringens]MDK0758020.1 hypothetical protein [Clostridium perfringens]